SSRRRSRRPGSPPTACSSRTRCPASGRSTWPAGATTAHGSGRSRSLRAGSIASVGPPPCTARCRRAPRRSAAAGGRPAAAPGGALLDGLAELLDRVLERLALEGATDRTRDPESDVDRLAARGRRLRPRGGELVRALDALQVALDETPGAALRLRPGVLERV